MNKKLLSVVIGAALAGSITLARADVTLYGQLDASIDSVDCDGTFSGVGCPLANDDGNGGDDVNMNSNYSAIGVRGFEDLGNGLKAIFQAEFEYNTASENDGNSLTDRDQWLGVAGDFGTLRLGRVFTSYRDHGAMIDPMHRTSLEGREFGGLQSGLHSDTSSNSASGLMSDTVRFDTADYNGLSASAFYTFDDGTNANNILDAEDEDTYGVGGQYKNGNILGYADYITNGVGDEDDAWKVGGSYTMGNIAFYGQYEMGGLLVDDFGNGSSDANIWHLGGSFTMGNTMLYGAYGQGDDDEGSETTAWTLAAMHSLSQRTKLYAGFNQVDEDNAGETDHFALGIRHSF